MNRTLFDKDIDVRFREYDEAHPEVWELFVRFCERLRGLGFKHYSADAVLHQIRWHHHVEYQRADFKINDHFSSRYARKLMAQRPEFAGFFELRRIA